MDFYTIKQVSHPKTGMIEVYPDFKVCRSKDLMIRGNAFYAVWDQAKGLWSTDEYDIQRLVDEDLRAYGKELTSKEPGNPVYIKYMEHFSSGSWQKFQTYLKALSDSHKVLDEKITFSNTNVIKEDYVSRRLPYPLEEGDYSAYDEMMSVLYEPEERAKIEWAIGAIISGDAKDIQKFLVLYGPGGTGKSTVIGIMEKLFQGYYTTFEAKSLTGSNNAFATEVFKSNPLVAIQHDGDLSKIEDNTKLNSIVSHEEMTMNEKYKASYTSRINSFLVMGSNKAVKITDAKSGLIRRLIDVQPTGNLIPPERYRVLKGKFDFELGAIARHCLDIYRSMGKDYYSSYRPTEMMLKTDVFFNYIEEYYDVFREQDGVTLTQAYNLYKQFCEESLIDFKLPQFKFREELKNYFNKFEDRALIDGQRVRSWFSGFDLARFVKEEKEANDTTPPASLTLDQTTSIFDEVFPKQPAQYASAKETPAKFWDDKPRMMTNPQTGQREEMTPPDDLVVDTVLSDIDTTKLHYVRPPLNHIVIDFDLKDDDGNKSPERNIEEASKWPATYAEFSKSGGGIHLHYTYTGDPTDLSSVYSDGVEVKVFTGNTSLRRKLTKCNNLPIASISQGLPLKEKKVINTEGIKSEKSLRHQIERNLRKEIHPGTKPSMDFIAKILDDAYNSGLAYDVTDMRQKIMVFANNSSNQAMYCLKLLQTLKLKGKEDTTTQVPDNAPVKDDRLVFFDVEVFPNLFLINWKFIDAPKESMIRMINPKPHEVESLFKFKLVGFNNRKYDNHMIYAASLGYSLNDLYNLSQKLISGTPGAGFAEAYNLSYADIYDFSSKKQSLKKFEIELGIKHHELGLPWDQPVPEEDWIRVSEYCDDDVMATEAVFKARKQDFVARQILAELSGLTVNDSSNRHSAQIIFEGNRKTQGELIYTDLREMFPGYVYEFGKSTYRGEEVGEGGYVYAEPGIHENVVLLDVESMHPTSAINMNLFGKYTPNFDQLLKARLSIKHKDFETARGMMDGKLKPYLEDEKDAKSLSDALKIVINSVYGLTSAKFDNPFRDPRNKDNIVAKRGALFMINLKHEVQQRGFTVVHIKTDSIKIANATPEIIEFVMEYGHGYGYTFEHEATYEKMALLNDAVYAAKTLPGKKPAYWTATGTQMIHPYVFKTLFSHEEIEFRDMCEAKSVKTALYLDLAADRDENMVMDSMDLRFIGKVGNFVPVISGVGGGLLLRDKGDGEYASATGAKGYLWKEAEVFKVNNEMSDIDTSYFRNLVDKAKDAIAHCGVVDGGALNDVEAFLDN